MGYALFTARKLALNTRVNNLNAQLMMVENQQEAITNKTTMKKYQSQLETNKTMSSLYSDLATATANGTDTSDIYQSIYDAQMKTSFTKEDAEIQTLTDESNALDTLRESLETQLKAAQNELESVEKAEESAIKSSTPSYTA
jgi:hypothetical protein